MILGLLLSICLCCAAEQGPIRFGVTPVILHDQHAVMTALRNYLQEKTGRVVELVPRNSYQQTIDLMRREEIDFAWVSAFPYVYLRHYFQVRMVAMPLIDGQPKFHAYLIVPADDRTTSSLLQLKGRIFAYADPYSHTGYIVPRYELQQAGKDPRTFFARTFFTSGHKKVIRAVASGLADAGSVDSYVWEALARAQPELTSMTRVVARSPAYGSPPIVARRKIGEADLAVIRSALLGMADDPEGIKLLRLMHMDGFIDGDPAAFDDVEKMMRATGDL